MKKLKLLKKLIKLYKLALKSISEPQISSITAYNLLVGMGLSIGICSAASFNFGIEICGKRWITKRVTYHGFWCKPPNKHMEKDEIIECISYRLNILKEEKQLTKRKREARKGR